MIVTPFDSATLERWKRDMSCDITRDPFTHRISGFKGYDPSIVPYDVYGTRGIVDIVPEFTLLGEPYRDLLERKFHFRYFHRLIESIQSSDGAPAGIVGIPYDFRRVLETSVREKLFHQFQHAIEESVTQSRRRAVVICHSLGGVLFKWFLTQMEESDPDWGKYHIYRFVNVNVPYGGSVMALKAVLCGEYYIPMFQSNFHQGIQTNNGIIMCLPNHMAFTKHDQVCTMNKPKREWYATPHVHMRDWDDLTPAFEIWRDLYAPHLPKIMKPLTSTPVSLHTSIGSPTLKSFKIEAFGEDPCDNDYEIGDGQVPTRSLDVAHRLFPHSRAHSYLYRDSNHISLICDNRFINDMKHFIFDT